MSTLQAPLDTPRQAPAEQRFLLGAVDWAAYRAISEALTGRHLHLAYDRGKLEFMTTSSSHSNYSRLLELFTFVLAEEFNLTIRRFGDMTCDREDLQRGLEPDECFYLQNEPRIRGKEELDLAIDPPPDLAQEVELTRSFVNRLGICEALRIPEVWRFNGKTLRAYHLSSDGRYVENEYSLHFPFLKVQELVAFLHKRTEMDEIRLIRLFRDWVRKQITQAGPTPGGTTQKRSKTGKRPRSKQRKEKDNGK
jgi:Uma2 family endonuclease